MPVGPAAQHQNWQNKASPAFPASGYQRSYDRPVNFCTAGHARCVHRSIARPCTACPPRCAALSRHFGPSGLECRYEHLRTCKKQKYWSPPPLRNLRTCFRWDCSRMVTSLSGREVATAKRKETARTHSTPCCVKVVVEGRHTRVIYAQCLCSVHCTTSLCCTDVYKSMIQSILVWSLSIRLSIFEASGDRRT